MFPILDLIASIGGLIIPPVFDFIKKKFIPAENDSPERTMGSLAMTKPEILPGYVEGMAKYLQAEKDYFNRDVSGTTHTFVNDIRALIRPLVVITALCFLFMDGFKFIELAAGARATMEACVTTWMGSRFNLK